MMIIRVSVRITGAMLMTICAGCSVIGDKPAGPFWSVAPAGNPPKLSIDLKLAPQHPRLVFSPAGPGRTFDDVRRLYQTDKTFKTIFDKQLTFPVEKQSACMLAACWIVTGEGKYADASVAKMLKEPLGKSGEPYYSIIWEHALAYDWLFQHPAMTESNKAAIAAKMAERLGSELDGLDNNEMALWHGRNQAANGVMVAALAIGDLPGQSNNLNRAVAHYMEALRALEFSEAWPEGASYWIYNRAGPYALAADCVISALGTDRPGGVNLREVMRKIGLWQVYQFGPNRVFEPYGDSAGSLKLGETGWWELTTDYYARLSRDPGLAAGADYIRNCSPSPYGQRPYYWYVALTYDPAVRPQNDYDPAKPELWMRTNLPQAMLFGRNSTGVAFFRGQWGDPDETYATFKAGNMLAHHDHYDVGHFGIQKGGHLAPETGLYGTDGYTSPHRLGYLIQTVSANSLLIMAPGETSAYLRERKDKVWSALSGGQRVIRPTGFDCVSLEHFRAQLDAGPHLRRAEITAVESILKVLDYIAADITPAYNSTRWAEPGSVAKVSLVTRQFVYLREAEAFVVYDRVETTGKRFTPKFLLHHVVKPEVKIEQQLAGQGPDDGILQTAYGPIVTRNGKWKLVHVPVLPAQGRTILIGGPHYNCYVEADGDESNGFNGQNLKGGEPLKVRDTKQLGLWRTEIEPATPMTSTRFLNLMFVKPSDSQDSAQLYSMQEGGRNADVVEVDGNVCVFARSPAPLAKIAIARAGKRLILFNAVPGKMYNAGGKAVRASKDGFLMMDTLPGTKVELKAE